MSDRGILDELRAFPKVEPSYIDGIVKVGMVQTVHWRAANEIERLRAVGDMLAALVEGAQEEFVLIPDGASRLVRLAIHEWHNMAAEALAAWRGEKA